METTEKKEEIKKNIVRISWVIIIIKAWVLLHASAGSIRGSFVSSSLQNTINSGFLSLVGIPVHAAILVVLNIVLSIALIYYSAVMMQHKENGRNAVSKLLIFNIILTIVTTIMSFMFVLPLGSSAEISLFFSYSFILSVALVLCCNGAFVAMYYLFYRFLNKQDAKAVFIEEMVQH